MIKKHTLTKKKRINVFSRSSKRRKTRATKETAKSTKRNLPQIKDKQFSSEFSFLIQSVELRLLRFLSEEFLFEILPRLWLENFRFDFAKKRFAFSHFYLLTVKFKHCGVRRIKLIASAKDKFSAFLSKIFKRISPSFSFPSAEEFETTWK